MNIEEFKNGKKLKNCFIMNKSTAYIAISFFILILFIFGLIMMNLKSQIKTLEFQLADINNQMAIVNKTNAVPVVKP